MSSQYHYYLLTFILKCLIISEKLGLSSQGYLSWRVQKPSNSYKVVCYMTNWAQYRPEKAKFIPSNIDPNLCTHLIYAFAAINTTNFEIKSFEWNDESTEDLVGRYEEFNNLKNLNPNLKTMLAVGGWNMGSKPFSDMSRSEKHRFSFVTSVVRFLRKWKFDGLDLDWEFPAKRDGSSPEDKRAFSHLVRDLRDAFYNEAMATRQEQLLLSAAVCAEQYTILKAYEIENIVQHLDFINIMSYDYHGSWDKKAGHNSPLYESQFDSLDDKRLTVDWTVRLYLTLGVPAEKLIVGIPYYGRSFTLKNKNHFNFGAETIGDGKSGNMTRENGFLAYGFEICKYLKTDNWTRGWNREHQVPYAYKDNQWVGYDDEESIRIKVDYIIKHCLGGAMVWSIDLDDFKNVCSDKTYPLTRLISTSLKESDRKKCAQLTKIKNDKDIEQYLREIVKWTPSSTEVEDSEDKYQAFFTTQTTTKPTSATTPTTAKTTLHSTTTTRISTTSKYISMFAKPITLFNYPTIINNQKVTPNYPIFYTQSTTSTTSSPRVFYLTNMFNTNNNKLLTTSKKVLTTRYQNNPAYEIDYKPEKLNELMLLAYQNSFYRNNESLLDQLFQQFLSNMTKSKLIDDNINAYRQANAQNRDKLFNMYNNNAGLTNNKLPNNFMFKNSYSNPSYGYEYLQATLPFLASKITPKSTTTTTTTPSSSLLLKSNIKNNYGCESLADGEFVRDPQDCSSFFTCFTGKATKKSTCNDGLYFDSKLRVCNWKANVECT